VDDFEQLNNLEHHTLMYESIWWVRKDMIGWKSNLLRERYKINFQMEYINAHIWLYWDKLAQIYQELLQKEIHKEQVKFRQNRLSKKYKNKNEMGANSK